MKSQPLKALSAVVLSWGVLLSIWIVCAYQTGATTVPQSRSAPAGPGLKPLISVLPLDLSRAPTTEELMAAGQLGGVLYPTRQSEDKAEDEAARLDFGKAIDKWNRHEYPEAVQLFKKHVQQFRESPWADEANLHVGCDATYNGNYPLAEDVFTQLIAKNQNSSDPNAKMMWSKATQRLALVKVEQNNLDEANKLFLDLKQNSPDWQHRTYAAHWLQRLSRYAGAREALLNCGAEALGYLLKKEGNSAAAATVGRQIPKSMRGHSISELVKMAAEQGYEMSALRIASSDLPQLPLPAVVHISEGSSGDKGHYWVLDTVQGSEVELYDPQSGRRFHQTVDVLAAQWSGDVLVLSKGNRLPGRKLNITEMDEAIGGCCGAPAAPDNTGDPGGNGGPGGGCGAGCCSAGGAAGSSAAGAGFSGGDFAAGAGAPIWRVDMISMNFYVTDTPMWYDPPIGPPVRVELSYNSQSSIANYEPFGNKWTFAYGGYLIMNTAGTITIFMPDGRMDTYSPDGAGGYTAPFRVYNTLTQIAPNHFQLLFPDGTVYVYQIPPGTGSQQPFLTEMDDAYGQKLSLGYNAKVELTTITDAQGDIFTLSYNSRGLVTSVADPFGRNTAFEYDDDKNLTQITDMGGYFSTLTYDTNAFVTSIADARGTTSFWTELPGPGGENSDNYPPPGDPNMFACYRITVTNAIGGLAEYFYYGGCDFDGYGSCGGYSWYVSPRDYIPWQSQTINNYRSEAPKIRYLPTRVNNGQQGEIWEILYPEGDYLQYGYDLITGDRLSVTDSHNYTWQYTYNFMGLPTSVTDALGNLTSYTYAANGVDLTAISNGLGAISLTYNPQHSILSWTDRLTNATTFAYNSFGQPLFQVDALGATNQFNYDANNRLSSMTRDGQTLLTLTYDSIGRVRTSTDATGLALTRDYSNLNQLVQLTYPDGKYDSYVYSTCCPHLIDSETGRNGITYNFNYDALKRLVQVINPDESVIQFGYDANGNKTSLTDPNGTITEFGYDLDNRLIQKTYADGRGFSLSYDQGGFLSTRTNARGAVTFYTFDANHNLLATSYSDGTPGVTNSYDAYNRLVDSLDAVGTNSYAYDADSRLINFIGPWAGDSIAYAYDVLNRRTNMSALGSQPVAYNFDALNRLAGVGLGAANYSYSFAGASPLVQKLSRPNGSYTTYQYDRLNRLTDLANYTSTANVINSFAYTYNAQDLRGSETVSNGPLPAVAMNLVITNNYNSLNQLLSSSQSNQAFAYDADGNMIQGYTPGGSLFSANFDAENRLISLAYTNTGALFSNQYIYSGRSLLAEVKEYQNGVLSNDTKLVRSGFSIIQERDSNDSVTRSYTWGLNAGGGIGGLLDLVLAGQSYSYIYDGNGNVRAVLDRTQTALATYAYDPFGVVVSAGGMLTQPFQFSTKHYDPGAGILDFGFRFYSPAIARWLTQDPAQESGGVNLYSYVNNDPIGNVDAIGLENAGLGVGDSEQMGPTIGPGPGVVYAPPPEQIWLGYYPSDVDERDTFDWIGGQIKDKCISAVNPIEMVGSKLAGGLWWAIITGVLSSTEINGPEPSPPSPLHNYTYPVPNEGNHPSYVGFISY